MDKLAAIYPAPQSRRSPLSQAQVQDVKKAFGQEGDDQLLKVLLEFERFPFNDPYVSFLRQSPPDIASNPQTVKRICDHARALGVDGVIRGSQEPKQFNRQMGAMFTNWVRKTYHTTPDVPTFKSSGTQVIFLDLPGEQLRSFANQIGCGLQKQPDFMAKAKGRYIVGEAKFIGTEGGNQNRGFDDAIKLASSSFKQAVTVAILDGIVWIPDSGQMSRRLANFGGNAVSAVLIGDFFKSP